MASNYLKLSPDELVALAKEMKEDFGLLIMERPAKVGLNESMFGLGWCAYAKAHMYSSVDKDGNKTHITVQNGDGSTLFAVTKQQYKMWKNLKIVSELHELSFGRIVCAIAQWSRRHDAVAPTEEMHRFGYSLKNFWRKLNG